MKRTLIFLVFCAVLAKSFAQQTRILFLGNSYTYVNDLPGTLSQLALSLGDSIYYDSNTPGGTNFNYHSSNTVSISKIALPGWDYVVLQDQSQQPSFPPAQVAVDTYPYAAKLDSLIHVSNPCAITMFYMTWGRKYGDASNCPFYTPLCTFEGMNDRLRYSYLEMTANNYARTAPVGVAWRHAREADSTINLWSADNSHPSVAGTYLTACVFYASIFKQSPVGSSYTAGLSPANALFLQNIASNTVLDSLDTWMLNQIPVHASFTDSVHLNSLQVNSTSYHATQFQWDFGDGTGTSTLQNPSYTYSSTGTYQVQLIASNQCYADTAVVTVQINSLSVDVNTPQQFSVYPNPANENLFIINHELLGSSFQLIDVNGRIVLTGVLNSNSIHIGTIPPGIYILRINNAIQRICIQ